MRTLLITYDLNSPGQSYTNLITRIKSYGSWWHYLESVWIVRTTHAATSARDDLGALVDRNDELLVLEVTGTSWAGWGFSDEAYLWLKTHL